MKQNLAGKAVCFEPLEPRLLLSGTWGTGADSPVSEIRTEVDNGPNQATVVNATVSEASQAGATGGIVDLLGAAPALNLVESTAAEAVPNAAPTESSEPTDTADSASPADSLLEETDHQSVRELVIVNDNVADYDQLAADLQAGDGDRNIEVAVLDANGDGIQQVSEILAQYSDLEAVHFIAHGADGQINIGGTWLNTSSLEQCKDVVSDWGKALNANGDMLFYGCSIASGSAGQSLLNNIASLTGADVAASEDPTGSTQLGGDWDLEFVAGTMETQIAVDAGTQAGWEHLMATPVITSPAAVDVEENQTAVTTVTATDADGDTPAFSITGGADGTFFSIDSATGELAFNSAPNYEAPADFDGDNVYEVEVTADDGNGGTDVQTISVTVTDAAATVPTISCPGIQVINEDNALVLSTANGNAISISGDDGDLAEVMLEVPNGTLTLNSTAGLTFTQGTNGDALMRFYGTVADINAALSNGLNFQPDADWNGSLSLQMTAADKTVSNKDPALLAHYSFDDAADPGQDSLATNNGTAYGDAYTVEDPERGNVLSLDGDGDYVEIADHFGDPTEDLTLTAWINIEGADTNGAEIISLGNGVGLRVIEDADGYKLQAFWDNGSVYSELTPPYTIGTGWHHVAFTMHQSSPEYVEGSIYVDGGSKYTAYDSWPGPILYDSGTNTFIGIHGNGDPDYDFNGKIDEVCIFNRVLDASEINLLGSTNTGQVNITVNPVNDAPEITTPEALTVLEGRTYVAPITATDTEGDTLDYTITGGADAGLFTINADRDLTFDSAKDFENPDDDNGDGVYEVEVTVDDGVDTVSRTFQVTLTDVSEPTIDAPDPQTANRDTALVFSTANGNPITVNAGDGGTLTTVISVVNGTLTVSVAGGTTVSGDGTATVTLTGSVDDINATLDGLQYLPATDYSGADSLTITTTYAYDAGLVGSYQFDIGDEWGDSSPVDTNVGTPVGNATVLTDPNQGDVLSLDGNGDYVQVDGMYGDPADVTLAAWVNLEAKDSWGAEVISLGNNVLLRLDDNGSNGLLGTFWNGTAYEPIAFESSLAGTGWHHVAFTFDDAGNTQSLYLDGVLVASGTSTSSIVYDQGFNTRIGSHGTGIGAGGDRYDFNGMIDDACVYSRALTASEISALALLPAQMTATDTVSITVNAAPEITSPSTVSVVENQTAVTAVTATDAEGDTMTFSITGGDDAGSFSINSTTGVLRFYSAPNFEAPADTDTNNVYEVEVTADDGNGGTISQTISVTVTDVVELPTVNVPTGATIAEDAGPLVFSNANSNRIWLSNIPASDPAEVELSVPDGVLTLSGTAGLTFSLGDGTGDSAMIFSGTAADINAALDGLSFQPDADYNGNLQIEINATNKRLSTTEPALMGHYSFEITTDAGDDSSSSGGNDAIVNGDATVVTDSTRGNVLEFDGDGDSLQVAGHLGVTNAVTLSAWVNLDAYDTNGAEIFSMGNDIVVRLNSNDTFTFGYWNGTNFIGTTSGISGGANFTGRGWFHLACTVEYNPDDGKTTTSFYVDGVKVGGGWSNNTGFYFDHGPDTYIGTHGDGADGYDFEGLMDEVCIFNRALSQGEIAALVEKTTAYVDVEVTPVNDAPQATNLNAAETYTEDTPLDLTDIVVSDVDNANVTVTLTLSDVAAGTLSTGTSGAATSTFAGGVWTASGAVADVNILLAGVTFTPAPNYDSNFSIAVSVDDGVAPAVTGSKAMTANPVNNAPSFTSGDGVVTTDFGNGNDGGRSVSIQDDGKVLVAGYSYNGTNYDFALVRYNQDGSLDTSFGGGGGMVTTDIGDDDVALAIKVLSDGSILVVGNTSNGGDEEIAVVRYNSDGSLDTGFGTAGILTTNPTPGGDDSAYGVDVQSTGRIIVSGRGGTSTTEMEFILVGYNSDGSPDTSFGTDGIVKSDFMAGQGDWGYNLVVQSDDKILLGGRVDTPDADFAVARYNANGSLDTSFGVNGLATVAVTGSHDMGFTIALQADGKIVQTGYINGSREFVLVRYNTDGSPDTSFGGGTGFVTTDLGGGDDLSLGITVQADGRILVSGYSGEGDDDNFALVRYDTDGSLDTSFGSGTGMVITDIGGGNDRSYSVAVQSDGRILVTGLSSNGTDYDFALVRYNSDGTLDSNFGNTLNGTPTYIENGTGVVLDADVEVSDADLDALNGGLGNYDGASLTLVRNGGANAEDTFSFNDGNGITLSSTDLVKGGEVIATFDTTTPGQLVINFTQGATQIATSADVDNILRQITYANSSDAPPASAQIDWTFNDGNSGLQGSGGALTATGSTTVSVTALNDIPAANDDNLSTDEDTALDIDVDTDLLANDTDPEGDTPILVDFADPANGTLMDNGDGTLTYTPDPDYNGADSFDYEVVDASSGLAHYWGLDGSATDSVGGADGTVYGPTTVEGSFGNGMSFDGTDDYVELPDVTYTDSFTISFDFKIDDNTGTGYQYLYSHGTVGALNSLNIHIGEVSGGVPEHLNRLNVRFADGDDADGYTDIFWDLEAAGIIDAAGVGDGQWHTFTMVVETGVGTTIYGDGVQLQTDTNGGGAFNPDAPLFLGRRGGEDPGDGLNRWLGSSLDSIKIFDRALSDEEVADLYSGTNRATVNITVNPVDDPAVISGDVSYNGNEGDTMAGDMDATDVEGLTDGTYFTVTTPAANGTAAIDAATGAWTFTPTDPDWFGTDSFTVTVTDDQGGTTTQIVNITLAADTDTGGTDTDTGDTDTDTGDTDTDTGDTDTDTGDTDTDTGGTDTDTGDTDTDTGGTGTDTESPPPVSPPIQGDQDYSDGVIPDGKDFADLPAMLKYLMHEAAAHKTARVMQNAGPFVSSDALSQTLDNIRQELDLTLASKAAQGNMIIGVATGLGVSVFAGYVIWAFRGATLLFGAVSAMPMWRCFDPLPVLLGRDKKRSEEEEEMTPEEEDAEDNVNDLLGINQVDSNQQAVIPEETTLM